MLDTSNKWPEHFPQQCPPKCAKNYRRIVYRFLEGDQPAEVDYLSFYEKGKQKWPTDELLCQACGLSVQGDLKEARQIIKVVPWARRKWKSIACAEIDEMCGVWLETPTKASKNHITFWPFAHTKCMNVFKLVSEDAYDGKGESGRTLGSNTGS